MRIIAAVIVILACTPDMAATQELAHDHSMPDMDLIEKPHLRLTPRRAATAQDSMRGDAIVAEARKAVEKYSDVAAAERDGYRLFAPRIKQQHMLHYTNRSNAWRARREFDPTRPTSLIYRRESDGSARLLGVMYTMPADASLEELDARIPLGLAQWHLHTNICIPRDRSAREAANYVGPNARFGPRGSITTEAECTAAGGLFREQAFGWMVHVNVMENDRDRVWGHERHMH